MIPSCLLLIVATQTQRLVHLTPDVQLGTGDDYTRPGIAAVSSQGIIAVGDFNENTIRIYRSTGELVARVGGNGQGPGQFQSLARLGWRGDTLWATDTRLARVSLFTLEGALIGTSVYRGPKLAEGLRATAPYGYLQDGTEVLMPSVSGSALAEGLHNSIPILAIRNSEIVAVPSRRRRGSVIWMIRFPGNGQMSTLQPYWITSDWDVYPDGRGMAFADVTESAGGRQRALRVSSVRSIADTTYSIQVPLVSHRPRQAVLDSAITTMVDHLKRLWDNPGAEAAVRENFRPPQVIPPVTKVVAGSDGTLWIRREDLGTGSFDWMVLDSRGRQLGFLHARSTLDILAASQKEVIAVDLDENDVPTVVRYRVSIR